VHADLSPAEFAGEHGGARREHPSRSCGT
jgi:hypothetical protein